jgi:alkylation response protein AidB-like acyl-CoA dehydrogenase
MQFAFDEEQQEIKRSAHEVLARHCSLETVRAAAEGGGDAAALWATMTGLGWPALAIGEAFGGLGLGLVALVALAEEVGWAVAPSALLPTACAALVVEAGGTAGQRDRWLPLLATGAATAAVGRVRDGIAEMVPASADTALLVLVEDERATLVADVADALEPTVSVDGTRGYGRVAANGGEALPGAWRDGVLRAEIVLAAELCGLAQRALDITVAYVREREQFGTPIGAFQGVSHRCAEMLFKTESARSATYFAAWTADAEPERLDVAAAMAKASAADAAREVAAMAIQAHGGIGFTWEADLHWIYKRAHLVAAQLGRPGEHRRAVARRIAGSLSAAPVGAAG